MAQNGSQGRLLPIVKRIKQTMKFSRNIFFSMALLIVSPDMWLTDAVPATPSKDYTLEYIRDTYMWELMYSQTIEYIKQHEGFANGRKYNCAAGKLTIGYGHVVQAGEFFPDQISRERAEQILHTDFAEALRLTDHLHELKGAQRLAVAHFIFSLGYGKYRRSDLRKNIESGLPVDSLWLQYSHYTTPGGVTVKSEYAQKIRSWELQLFNNRMPVSVE